MDEILFLCSGNYYRSRFAEAVFNHEAARAGLPWRAFSRGLAIWMVEGDLSPWTAMAMNRRGIARTMTGATRVAVAEHDLQRAHLVIALKEAEHRPMMREQFPHWEQRVEYWTVHDLDAATPDEALPAIEEKVLALVRSFAAESRDA